jgi:hypothetical protein
MTQSQVLARVQGLFRWNYEANLARLKGFSHIKQPSWEEVAVLPAAEGMLSVSIPLAAR